LAALILGSAFEIKR